MTLIAFKKTVLESVHAGCQYFGSARALHSQTLLTTTKLTSIVFCLKIRVSKDFEIIDQTM